MRSLSRQLLMIGTHKASNSCKASQAVSMARESLRGALSLDAVRTHSKSKKRPPTSIIPGDESPRRREGAAEDAESAPGRIHSIYGKTVRSQQLAGALRLGNALLRERRVLPAREQPELVVLRPTCDAVS